MPKPPSVSSILGRARYKPKIRSTIVEPIPETNDDRAATIEIEVDAITGRKVLRLARAMFVSFGQTMGQALTGGGIEVEGKIYSIAETRAALADFDVSFWTAVLQRMGELDMDELDALLCAGLAGYTRFRVQEHPNGEDPSPDAWSPWHRIEEGEDAAEALDELFVTMDRWLRVWLQQLHVSILPTLRALSTNAGSKAGATSNSPEADTPSKMDSPSSPVSPPSSPPTSSTTGHAGESSPVA